LHFQERPWDLWIAVGYTLVIASLLIILGGGNLLGLLLVLFIPGYVIVSLLFPKNSDIDWIERTGLSLGLSVAIVPFLVLLLSLTTLGIRLVPIIAAISLFTVFVAFAAYKRRMRLPVNDRLAFVVDFGPLTWKTQSPLDKVLTVALAASIVSVTGTLVYVNIATKSGMPSSEFYILGPTGNASGYPTVLAVGQPGTVIVGIANHEFVTVEYAIRVDLVGVIILFNSTCGCNQSQRVNSTTIAWLNATVPDGGNWSEQFTFTINVAATWQVRFLLLRANDLKATYEEVHLFVRVG